MTTFPSLSHFEQEARGESLTLPLRDRDYTWQHGEFPLRAALTINRLRAAAIKAAAAQAVGEDAAQVILTDDEEQRLAAELIGAERLAQMEADGVTLAEYNHIYFTVLTWAMWGEAAARTAWLGDEGDARPPAEASGSTRTPAGSSKKTSAKAPTGRRSSTAGTSSKPRSRRSTTTT